MGLPLLQQPLVPKLELQDSSPPPFWSLQKNKNQKYLRTNQTENIFIKDQEPERKELLKLYNTQNIKYHYSKIHSKISTNLGLKAPVNLQQPSVEGDTLIRILHRPK